MKIPAIPLPPAEMRKLVTGDDAVFRLDIDHWDYQFLDSTHFESVFDFGCGCGRVARQMLSRAVPPDRYLGVDINRSMVEWCERHLAPLHDEFRFVHHDVYNINLGPDNTKRRSAPLPAPEGYATLAVAHSVFTHLALDQTIAYLHELRRILRPGGVAKTTWFLFARHTFPMMAPEQVTLFINESDPTNAVIYDWEWLRQAFSDAGFRIVFVAPPHVPGHQWEFWIEPRVDERPDVLPSLDELVHGLCAAPQDAGKLRDLPCSSAGVRQSVDSAPSDDSPVSSVGVAEAIRASGVRPKSDPDFASSKVNSYESWYHTIEVAPGVVTPGVHDSGRALRCLDRLGLPEDCAGLRALDIGCRDGFFSFELERRGATVIAIDYADPQDTGFPIAAELLGSKASYRVENVYDLGPDRYGQFDIVLFLGVLYHLRNPLAALDNIRLVIKEEGLLYIETQMATDPAILSCPAPAMQFFSRDELYGDPTSKWAPNVPGLRAIVEECQFGELEHLSQGGRGYLRAVATSDPSLAGACALDRARGVRLMTAPS